MQLQKMSWRETLADFSQMISDDRSGDLIALVFALILTGVVIALLPV